MIYLIQMKKKMYYNIWKSPFKIRFQKKKNISSSGAQTHELRAEIEKFFVRFLVQMKSAKSPFEIHWPLIMYIMALFFLNNSSITLTLIKLILQLIITFLIYWFVVYY